MSDDLEDRLRHLETQQQLIQKDIQYIKDGMDKWNGAASKILFIIGGGFIAALVTWIVGGGLVK